MLKFNDRGTTVDDCTLTKRITHKIANQLIILKKSSVSVIPVFMTNALATLCRFYLMCRR